MINKTYFLGLLFLYSNKENKLLSISICDNLKNFTCVLDKSYAFCLINPKVVNVGNRKVDTRNDV